MTPNLPPVASLLLCLLVPLCALLLRQPRLAHAGHYLASGEPPGGGQRRRARSGTRKTTSQAPSDPSRSGLSDYPDRPLKETPRAPVTPRFVVEHRTALGGREVTVCGLVVAVARDPSGSARPRLFLAETSEPERDRNYDLMVLLSEEDAGGTVGEELEVRGTVESSKVAVYLRKSY
jgi:hypothetical protein